MAKIKLNIYDTIEAKIDSARVIVRLSNYKDDSAKNLCEKYDEAAELGANRFTKVLNIIKGFGVNNDEITTGRIAVSKVVKNVRHEEKSGNRKNTKIDTSYKNKLIGYRYDTYITLEIPCESTYLSKLYCKLTAEDDIQSVDVSFFVKDTDIWYDKLLENMIKKATHQANIIAKVGGIGEISLDKVYKSSYSSDDCSVDCLLQCNDYDSFEDDDCDYTDAVSVVLDSNMDKPVSISANIDFIFKTK